MYRVATHANDDLKSAFAYTRIWIWKRYTAPSDRTCLRSSGAVHPREGHCDAKNTTARDTRCMS